jgi:hypothetical protein
MNDGYVTVRAQAPTMERTRHVAKTLLEMLDRNDVDAHYDDLLMETGFTRTETDAAFVLIAMTLVAKLKAKQIG